MVLLCWVVVGNVYPITRRTDYPDGSDTCTFFGDEGRALKPGFNAHCAAISVDDGYQAATNVPAADYDEIVVQGPAQVLPQYRVYFRTAS